MMVPAVTPFSQDPANFVAVIDIGSNSIRLVVHASRGCYPFPLLNERSNCRLGLGLGDDGLLKQDRIVAGLTTLGRFAALLENMGVTRIYPVATAAVRRAANAAQFVEPAEAILGRKINVLSQQDEARLVAEGINLNVQSASGLVADLGGGSLEIVALQKNVVTASTSFNFGHLSDITANEVTANLAEHKWIAATGASRIYGVGGSFRALGSAFIEQTDYPLSVLHGLNLPADTARGMLASFAQDFPDLTGVPLGRRRSMPAASVIMGALLDHTGVDKITITGTSIREGIIAEAELNAEQRADFLQVVTTEIASMNPRFAGAPHALMRLLAPLYGGDYSKLVQGKAGRLERMVNAACHLADLCWNEHQDKRGDLAARRVLGLPVNCLTQKERAWLALAIHHRYVGGKTSKALPFDVSAILSRRKRVEATMIGLGLRFALSYSGGIAAGIDYLTMMSDGTNLTLNVAPKGAALMDGLAHRRFAQLAESAVLSPKISGI